MINVKFYDLDAIEDEKLKYAVIVSKYNYMWINVRHKERETWEIPGGHREGNERIDNTAERELIEETGAKDFKLYPVCIYSVERETRESFGQVFYADVFNLGELPYSEIGEVRLFDTIPENLTYPLMHPFLFEKVLKFLEESV